MINPHEFAQWYYLIYLLPGGISLLLLLLSALGGGMRHGHHAGGHGGHHSLGHHSLGHHLLGRHLGHHGHGHAPVHATGGHKHGGPHSAGPGREPQTLLTFFGLGRVPSPLVWGSALLGWGLFGFWGTQFWQSSLHLPALFLLPSLATALAGAFVMEKLTVEAAARLLPREESYVTSAVELCGLTGTVVYPADETRGRVQVYDVYGTLHDVFARSAPGQGRIPQGRKVLIVDYDAARDQAVVEEVA